MNGDRVSLPAIAFVGARNGGQCPVSRSLSQGTLMNQRDSDCRGVSSRNPEKGIFTEQRLVLYGSGVALGYVLGLVVRLVRHQWVVHPGNRPCTDFIWIWLSSKFASSAIPVEIYNHAAFSAAKAALVPSPDCILGHFDNPPTLLIFTYLLHFFSYPIAFAAWIVATLLVYLAAVYAVIPRPAAVIAALTPFPVFFNVLLGHNGFLTAGLAGLALASMECRPWLAGIFLALLAYKPQFGILFPLALLASGNWRAGAGAAVAGLLLAAMAAAAFGWQTWPAFIGALGDRAWSLSETPRQAFAAALVSVFGTLRSVGVGAEISWSVQLAITAIVAATVTTVWARPIPYPLKAASLAVGSLLASPHVHGYDVCILTIGIAFLVKDALARGFLPGERSVILLCWAALFLLTGPIPAIVCVVLLILVVRRAIQISRPAATTPAPIVQPQGPTP
jgi:arabinofuranan 3-O-arabinosyltransferase